MPNSGLAEIYFIAAMFVLILVVCAVAVFFFFRTLKREQREQREREKAKGKPAETIKDQAADNASIQNPKSEIQNRNASEHPG